MERLKWDGKTRVPFTLLQFSGDAGITMSQLETVVSQIQFARRYTERLLDQIEPAEWFKMVGVTHVAWQVGHLAFAQYSLGLERIRGPRAGDAELYPPLYSTLFGGDSVPNPDPVHNPSPAELRDVFDRVHRQLVEELQTSGFTDAELDAPFATQHPLCQTRGELLFWCCTHEMVHAGQIGLIRRLLGQAPLW